MTDTVLVLAWLVLAHLIADFVLQNDWIAINKATGGRNGWAALSVHGFHVGLCLVPAVLAFGVPGLVYLLLVAFTHVLVDRWKVRATRRAEKQALEGAVRRHAGRPDTTPSGLGIAWTPWPGMLFLADQALHLTIALVGWVVIVEGRALLPPFVDVVNRILGTWDRATVHAVVLTSVVLVSLFLVNTRAAYYFILALVSPRDVPDLQAALASVHAPAAAVAEPAPAVPTPAEPAPAPAPASAAAANPAAPVASARAEGMTVQVGPMVATIDIAVADGSPDAPDAATVAGHGNGNGTSSAKPPADPTGAAGELAPTAVPSGAPARIGATIGALERLLIVTFVLVNAIAAVGFVIAAKTLARFKQLDDRGFAEYYLLGTLASAAVAIGSALVAQAALATLP